LISTAGALRRRKTTMPDAVVPDFSGRMRLPEGLDQGPQLNPAAG
jgi:hypothetical protein